MLKQTLQKDLKEVVKHLGFEVDLPAGRQGDIVCSIHKNPAYGDYTSNIALQLANQKSENLKRPASTSAKRGESPIEIAKQISKLMKKLDYLEKVEVAGSGFINFFFKDSALMENIPKVCDYSYFVNPPPDTESEQKEKKIFMEYAQPNTHKPFHLGHARGGSMGESISRLLEATGDEVFRSTYGSDIGLPVAKAIWGVQKLEEEEGGMLLNLTVLQAKAEFLGKAYAKGAAAYEDSEDAKKEINALNLKIYQKDPSILPLWEQTRKWSLEYFDQIYEKLGIKFDRVFVESEVEAEGKKLVTDNIGKVFKEDQGAIIFEGENYGLHNRVFISSVGNPTYEAKDLGLSKLKWETWQFDLGIIQTGSEQLEYFKVMFKALELIDSSFKDKFINLPYGMVNLTSGKMSSRKGNVITFDWLLEEVSKRVASIMNSTVIPAKAGIQEGSGSRVKPGMTQEEREQIINTISIGAIKFSMLKYSPATDITFDLEKSVSLEGDSGPYVQYTYARAKSVLRSAQYDYRPGAESKNLEDEERLLLQKIEHFSSIIEEAVKSYSPNTICLYLLEMSRLFNLFYQKHSILKGGKKLELRLALTCAVAVVLKQGLYLLGIEAPERM